MRRLAGLLLSLVVAVHIACTSGRSLPPALTDEEFWNISDGFSEPAGSFTHSDNLVSNEMRYVHLVRTLGPSGGAYIGVGPEQNFSYIAALRPEMAFIVDIRRENRNLHLMYKALFELSADRAEFLSRLFSRERPAGLGPRTSVDGLFEAYQPVQHSEQLHAATAGLIREHLLGQHRLPLTAQDLEWIDYAFRAFYSDGPDIHYARLHPNDSPGPSYRALMTIVDVGGASRSFLSTESAFAFVKTLHAANRIVPIVGDFGGPDALRRVGDYIRKHETIVKAFYASNVEVYLTREKMNVFCQTLARLPSGSRTWYIGSKAMQPLWSKVQSCWSGGGSSP